jgi:hypothetical protein
MDKEKQFLHPENENNVNSKKNAGQNKNLKKRNPKN